jgi:hypothetical protein
MQKGRNNGCSEEAEVDKAMETIGLHKDGWQNRQE